MGERGILFTLDWLLRNTNTVATGRVEFSSLDAISIADFKQALEISARYVSQFLHVAAGHLAWTITRVLTGRYAIPVICRMLHLAGGHFAGSAETGRVLYWYLHSALWGRYAGPDSRCPGLRQRPATAQPSAGAPRRCPNPPHLPQNGSIRGRVPEKSG